ncbi:hypothetical protein [Streptomyces sp. URMC 123]|uniref:transmembrane-type terpene cyclase n=1 Tax=Streptomyces sp. URMC 123 TaxID=3423403 RepID=UPI003F1D3CDD
MQVASLYAALQTVGALCWTVTYVLAIRQGFREKVYAIPIAALWANWSWEFIYTFLRPPAHEDPQLAAVNLVCNAVWFLLNCVILWTAVRYGRRQFPGVSVPVYAFFFAAGLATAFGVVYTLGDEFRDPFGARAAFGMNLLMSVGFLMMFHARRGLLGQSLGIAVFKFLGTSLASVAFVVHPPHPNYEGSTLLPLLYAVILLFDLIYIGTVFRARSRERGQEGPRPGSPDPAAAPEATKERI